MNRFASWIKGAYDAWNRRAPLLAAQPIGIWPSCHGCGKLLLMENLFVDDGCPCNSARGVNMTPKPCSLCRTDDCVKPGHRIAELFGHTVHPNCGACPGDGSVCERACRVERESPASELADVEDINRLRALVYVPGAWQCPKCKLRIVRTIMSAATGEMHANEETEPCPNGCGPLWRISERGDRKEAQRSFIDQCDELTKAKARITELEQAARSVAQTTHHPDDTPSKVRVTVTDEMIDKVLCDVEGPAHPFTRSGETFAYARKIVEAVADQLAGDGK